MQRKFPRKIQRVVVKVGSSLVADSAMRPREVWLDSFVKQICDLRDKNIEVVIVSSGAIALGLGELGARVRPGDTPSLQAAAAIGQALLMRLYHDRFRDGSRICAQVLLTWDDFANRVRFNNARNTLNVLLAQKVTPVINENDTISTDEIKFGDNDKLSALVASLVQADLLIMFSDVDGFYRKENGKMVEKFYEIHEITGDLENFAGGAKNKNVSKGGMTAKLNAVKISSAANIPSIIADGRMQDAVGRIVVDKEPLGTYFFEKEEKLLLRKHWILFVARNKGRVTVDDGARKALLQGKASLLFPGVVGWKGVFESGDVVIIEDVRGDELARGITSCSVSELTKSSGKKDRREFVHVDNLVVTGK